MQKILPLDWIPKVSKLKKVFKSFNNKLQKVSPLDWIPKVAIWGWNISSSPLCKAVWLKLLWCTNLHLAPICMKQKHQQPLAKKMFSTFWPRLKAVNRLKRHLIFSGECRPVSAGRHIWRINRAKWADVKCCRAHFYNKSSSASLGQNFWVGEERGGGRIGLRGAGEGKGRGGRGRMGGDWGSAAAVQCRRPCGQLGLW